MVKECKTMDSQDCGAIVELDCGEEEAGELRWIWAMGQ